MKNLITAVLLLFFFSASSQTWIQQGATWHYEWLIASCVGFDKLVYTKDTVINNRTAQKIETYRFDGCKKKTDTLAPQFVHRNGDTIFYLFNNKFEILYNFAAAQGDTWILGVNPDTILGVGYDTSAVVVDSVGTIEINGINHKWISVSCVYGSFWRIEGKITDRFGAMERNLFPISVPCDTLWDYPGGRPTYTFTCYEDEYFPLYNPSPKSCEYWREQIGIDDPGLQEMAVKIFPNPATEKLHIKLNEPKGNYQIQIFDATGKKFTNRSIGSGEEVVDISALPKGIYFVLVTDEKGNFYSQKIMKM